MTPGLLLGRARRTVRRGVVGGLARAAMLAHRPQRLALVYGAPDYEENSLVTALRLTERYPGRVVLVCTDPAATRRYLTIVAGVIGGDPAAIELQVLDKWRVLRTYGQAELVFYTHGLFATPPAGGRRLHVNLWHGTGPKSSANHNFASSFRADALSSASPVWGLDTARILGSREPLAVLPGNARADLLVRTPEVRSRLGWDDQPVVLWLPTYRQSADVSVGTLREGTSLLQQGAADLHLAAEQAGVRLIVKPHPFDAEALGGLGIELLTTAQLWDQELTLGQTLASANAVISDYSSAWVDALAAGVPIGLYCPDLDAYDRDRGFNAPPMTTAAAGLFVTEPDDLAEFFAATAGGMSYRADAQAACVERLGLVAGPRCAELLRAVGELGLKRLGSDFGLATPAAGA